MKDHFAIRGVITEAEAAAIGTPGARSTTYPRLEIEEFSVLEKHRVKWSLYLQALAAIQEKETKIKLGYFQLAGIHGLPLQSWPIGDGPRALELNNFYCTHHTNRFLPWHRVYLLLFEQVIVLEAKELVKKYPENVHEAYMEQASQIRLPYWDWAKVNGHNIPDAVTTRNVSVIGPNGDEMIQNPLYSYKLPEGAVVDGIMTETERDPGMSSLRNRVFHMLNETRGFNYVASDDQRKANSLEDIHNNIHVQIGGGMNGFSIAAFDPIFWLHHANIDRIYAMWQAMNPDAHYTKSKFDRGGRDPHSDRHLAPFYFNEAGREWKLNMVQKLSSAGPNKTIFDHGYHYPDITLDATKEATAEEVRLRVMKLYGPRPKNETAKYPEGAIELSKLTPVPVWAKELPATAAVRHEWIVYYRVEKYLVENNFTVYFFCGEPGNDPKEWSLGEHLVGSMSSFKFTTENCANCEEQRDSNLMISGEIQLTTSILHHSKDIADLGGVEAWLTKALTWRVMNEDGTEHIPTKGLVVGVKSCMTAYPPYSDLDGFRDYKLKDVLARTFEWRHHHAITARQARIGGVVVPVS